MTPDMKNMTEQMLTPGRRLSPEAIRDLVKGPDFEAYMKYAREQRERDWPNLCRYKNANLSVSSGSIHPTVVFMGDSITENWGISDPVYFSGAVINRGIGGQTSPQMLLRFYQDVVSLHPRVVHLMTGTNDLGGATGPSTLQDYKNNVLAMLDLAKLNDIRVVLAAIPPCSMFWATKVDPRAQIREINAWLKSTAAERHLVFVDYAEVLAAPDGGIRDTLSNDNVHPTRPAYDLMKPLAERAIASALGR